MVEEDVGNRVLEWEDGLPSADDLTPLFQPMVPPQLASAFSVTPEPFRTYRDVQLASQKTFLHLCRRQVSSNSSSSSTTAAFNLLPSLLPFPFPPPPADRDDDASYSESSKKARVVSSEEILEDFESNTNSGGGNPENSVDDSSGTARGGASSSKKPRLVWTPQLHKRFVDVVAHLGLKNAVPKTIMRLMNVDGLTRENVASHLQKYRLYMNRMQSGSERGDDFIFFG